MRAARATASLPLPVDEAWRLLVDARHHARWIPLTTVTASGDPALGVEIRAVSAGGVLGGFVDRMRIDRLDPPVAGRARVAVFTKLGPVLLGRALIAVRAGADRPGPGGTAGGTNVLWIEDVHLAGPLPRALTRALLKVPLTLMMQLALRAARREAEAASPPQAD
ncbi:hypothetical protein KIN34_01805 [Cellulomonas sp. DKR-3]|uniref:Polyketide cyclase n=1 Tax=Cellulomonas fulva TaxID=2835530 RepID=A0ABS5TV44_9CELL|nr:hypothetical protein [Cellulomonas fulva]MBT0993026.1 hypothetical protein [Cellulomonas fulva]